MPQPQRKVAEFIEELEKAQGYEEALKVLKRAETYFQLEGDYSVIPFLVTGYYNLSHLDKADEFNRIYLSFDKSGMALYYQALIESTRGYISKAITFLRKARDMTTDKFLKFRTLVKELFFLAKSHRYSDMEKLLSSMGLKTFEDIKEKINSLPEEYKNVIDELSIVLYRFKRYKEAEQYFSSPEGKNILDAINEILRKYIKEYELDYAMEYDYEDPIKTPFVYVHLKERYSRNFLEQVEDKIIEDVIFKHGTDVVVSFILPKEEKVAAPSI